MNKVTLQEQEKTIRLLWNKQRYTLDFMDFPGGLHEATVKDLKSKCKELTDVPIATMNLKVSGAHIKDDTATLESVGVHSYCIVELNGELVDKAEVDQQTNSGNPEEYGLVKRIANIVDDLSTNMVKDIDAYEALVLEQQQQQTTTPGYQVDEVTKKKMQDQGIYCSERLIQTLIRLDAVECPLEFDTARQKRRESVRFTQQLLDKVDKLRGITRSIIR